MKYGNAGLETLNLREIVPATKKVAVVVTVIKQTLFTLFTKYGYTLYGSVGARK